MKPLYLQILKTFKKEEIQKKYQDKNLPYVKHIDLYKGQDFNEKGFETHLYPALFFKWSIDHKTNPPMATLTFRLCWEELRDSSSNTNSPKKALDFFDFIEVTKEILEELESDVTGKFIIQSEEFNLDDTIVDTYTLIYTCNLTNKKKKYLQGKIEDLKSDGQIFETLN